MRQSDGGPGSGPAATPVPGLRATQLSDAILRAADNAGVGIVVSTVVDGKIRLAYVSEGAARIIGQTPEALLHKAADAFAAPEERPRINEAADKRARGEPTETVFESVFVHKDGRRVSVASATSPIEVDGVPGSVTFVWDTTELQTAKQAVRAGEARFHAVIEAAPEGVVISREGIVLYANPTAERMLISEGDRPLVGRSLAEFMSPEDTMAMRDRIRRATRGERFAPREYRAQRADGTVVTAEIVSLPFMHEGAPAVLAFARDVTERSRMQAQLAHADRLAALGTMAASVAHEINNPVTVMSFDLDLLGRLIESALPAGESRAAALGLLTDLRHSVGRVASIVRDLKAFSRPEEAASDAVEIGVAMESALRIASHAHGRDIEVRNEIGALPPVRANRGWLEQIFVNLLMNAFQAMPDDRSGNRVVLRATVVPGTPRDGVAVEIVDNGPGIPPEVLGRIFDPFFTTKPVGVGTGLGLSICHGLVTEMGGQITATSALGQGTTMRVQLPAHALASQAAPVRVTPTSAQSYRSRVLIIDDEVSLCNAFQMLLQDEHDVSTVHTGEAGLRAIVDQGPFDLVLCDLMMADLSGMDLYERLAKTDPATAARIVFMTGGAFTARARDFLDRVPNQRLTKPFSVAEVEGLLRGRAS